MTIASDIFSAPAPRWRSFGLTARRKFESWVSPEELARIEAGVLAGTIEVRVVRDRVGMVHQWMEVKQ